MSFVIVDLETTGLDALSDSIIEVALLRIDARGNPIESWSSLVNPGFVIHEDITFLTGITPEDLEWAPSFQSIRDTILRFVGDSPIMGHNVWFDLAFLRANGIRFETSQIADTFRLSEFLYYKSKSLNLTSITEELGYVHEWAHRAPSDVRATAYLWSSIVSEVEQLSSLKKSILLSVSSRTFNDWSLSFLAELLSEQKGWEDFKGSVLSRFAMAKQAPFVVPESIPDWQQVMESAKDSIEERAEQRKMMESVERVFQNHTHLCIEAPTGIGKTFAYLIPGLISALRAGKQVFVSTNTKTLQDQIEYKDIPRLRDLFRPFGLDTFHVQKLKGRTNYVSLLKFFEWYEKEAFVSDEAIFTLKVAFWLTETETGETDEFSLYNGEYAYLDQIHAGDLRVLAPENPHRDYEFVVRAREGVKEAQIVILNHALLLSEYLEDAGRSTLPKIEYLVLDEVHNLESVATESLKKRSDFDTFSNRITNIEKLIKRYNKQHPTEPFIYPELQNEVDWLLLSVGMFFETCESRFQAQVQKSSDSYASSRFQDILVEADFFESSAFEELSLLYDGIAERIRGLEQVLFLAPQALMEEVETERLFLNGFVGHLREFLYERSTPLIRIFSKREGEGGRILSVPLEIGSIMCEKLWKEVRNVVITSATLTIESNFDYLTKMLSLEDFEFERLKTDFDYSKQALLFIPAELWDVRKQDQKRIYESFLVKLLKIVKWRTLMLFTSFASIKETTLALAPELRTSGIRLLTQGMSGGKHKLVHEFRKHSDTSVLLGTDSFWEWVDFPGETLEFLVIHKFPFAVPTDPVFMARSRLFSDPFRQYAIPVMILKLKQGIGRLIRTKTDSGVIILLDTRISTDWWDLVRQSLPEWLPIRRSDSDTFLHLLEQSRAKFARDTTSC